MPHSLQIHAYNGKTHKIRRKLKTKYICNKNKLKNNDQYLAYKPRLTLPKEFLNDNNDLKLTMLGDRLFQTLMIRSLKSVVTNTLLLTTHSDQILHFHMQYVPLESTSQISHSVSLIFAFFGILATNFAHDRSLV